MRKFRVWQNVNEDELDESIVEALYFGVDKDNVVFYKKNEEGSYVSFAFFTNVWSVVEVTEDDKPNG